MDYVLISVIVFILFAGIVSVIIYLGRESLKKSDESFELCPERFHHVIVKSKDPYTDTSEEQFGCIHFIDKMTFEPIDVEVSFDDYLNLLVNYSYNIVLKGNRIIDLRKEDF